jgi:hypothetical protein
MHGANEHDCALTDRVCDAQGAPNHRGAQAGQQEYSYGAHDVGERESLCEDHGTGKIPQDIGIRCGGAPGSVVFVRRPPQNL